MIVVIPTRREIRLDYLGPLIEAGARFIIVDDTKGTIRLRHPSFRVFNWDDKHRVAGRWQTAFPGLNGACMSFGFYLAWNESDDDEIIITLGDDCRIDSADFAQQVTEALVAGVRPIAATPGRFFNTIDMLDIDQVPFSRGFPYSARLDYTRYELCGETTERAPAFNLGLWWNVLDINAIDKLGGLEFTFPNVRLHHESLVVPFGTLLSVSSGNMQFRRRLIPAAYQLPMHFHLSKHWVIDRFGDIWGGFVLKSLMDKVGDVMTVGEPRVFHVLPGYLEENIQKEHVCNLVNDEFISLLDESLPEVAPGRYEDMVAGLREAFLQRAHRCSPLLRPYIEHLCDAWRAWTASLAS